MAAVTTDIPIQRDAAIPTWFQIGGRADRLATPRSIGELARCVEIDPALRVLGAGANLLVDDDGVGELVVAMTSPVLTAVRRDAQTGLTIAMAGADLPKLVVDSVRQGLSGLEGLGGIPATIGGALVMNAGGASGQIANVVTRVHAIDREGKRVTIERDQIAFGYRTSGLGGLVLVSAELDLRPGDPAALRVKLKEVMALKKASQPMAENSAGCCFKNPTLARDMEGFGPAGKRISAGMLIDRAGLKGTSVRGAAVSEKHGNFIVTTKGAAARDVIELMDIVKWRVIERFGVSLDPEVVIWRRTR